MAENDLLIGKITRISGPVVGAEGITNIRLHDMVRVGEAQLVGEVIRLAGDLITIQVYEDTSGVRLGEPIINSGKPLVAQLGPGLIGNIFDGLQRPLTVLAEKQGGFLQRGMSENALSMDSVWNYQPTSEIGSHVKPGNILGVLDETPVIQHRIMVPVGYEGKIVEVQSGKLHINDPVAWIETNSGETKPITMVQFWPVRAPRPIKHRLGMIEPLVTGKRIIDLFFPIPKGGSAIIPGGFGTGKTVLQQSLARWSEVDVVVYVGCGERGNEIAEVLTELPKIEDRTSGSPLINRTVLIANTSNMPVAAREASIYMGVTIAEYYRDMGMDVLMLADSTSRWGEALREVSGRLEEIPGEEGYPAYMASRLSEFYERSGHISCLGEKDRKEPAHREGSISLVGAISPPGGDFSDPITQSSMRITAVFWALDYELSRRRHFPAINWTKSFSLVDLSEWYDEKIADDFSALVREATYLLRREDELLQIVQLVGQEALSDLEREVLTISRLLREDILQQSAIHATDDFCSLDKSYWMLKVVLSFHHLVQQALQEGASLSDILNLEIIDAIARMKEIPIAEAPKELEKIISSAKAQISAIKEEAKNE